MKNVSDKQMKFIVKYINKTHKNDSPFIVGTIIEDINKKITKLMTEEGLTKEEQKDYWDFYQKKENVEFDENDEVISFKPFLKGKVK